MTTSPVSMQLIPASVVEHHASTAGGTYQDSYHLFEELRKFFVAARLKHSKCTPSRVVDEAWHFFLEHGNAYHVYFEEQGLAPIRHLAQEGTTIEAYADTLDLLNRTFGTTSPKYWPTNIAPAECGNCATD